MAQLDERAEQALRRVPQHLQEGLRRYVEDGVRPGGFLQAVLSDELYDAIARMNPASWDGLRALVEWLMEFAPDSCYGARAMMEKWIAERVPSEEE